MSDNKLTTILDLLGRTIIGETDGTKSNSEILALKNPAIIHIQPDQQSGQIRLQILPLFFKEFLADKEASTTWLYRRANIVESVDIVYDFKVSAQYAQMFSSTPLVIPQSTAPAGNSAPVIKLFDDEK